MFEVPYVGADMQSMNERLASNNCTFLSAASPAAFFHKQYLEFSPDAPSRTIARTRERGDNGLSSPLWHSVKRHMRDVPS